MTGANPASEEVMSLQRPIPSLARPLSRLSPLTLALRCALLGLSAVGAGLLGGGLAHAQSVGQHSAATRLDDATPRSYDIPAGSLGASLGAFASQSGLLLSFAPALTRGRTAPALKGRYSVLEGLQRVLSNTGLQVAAGTSGAYLLVEPRMSGEAPADLSPVVVSAAELADPQKETYTAPRSSVYLSSEDIDRFGRVSVGDLLQGIPGVQVGDSRNGGALDVNIRGIQGQSRVAVRVDGAEQALDVYRGYAGTQQRSYIDPDLVSSVTVDKGPSTRSGAIGGSVEMRTIGVKDILVDGKDLGVRFTGDVWNNGVARSTAAPVRRPRISAACRTMTAAACSAPRPSPAAPPSPTATSIWTWSPPMRSATRATTFPARKARTAIASTTATVARKAA